MCAWELTTLLSLNWEYVYALTQDTRKEEALYNMSKNCIQGGTAAQASRVQVALSFGASQNLKRLYIVGIHGNLHCPRPLRLSSEVPLLAG